MRAATPDDIPAITAFLTRHIETSMFLLGNLEAHGIGASGHPHATRYLLREDGGITGVFGHTQSGFLMCQMPNLTQAEAQACIAHLKGQPVQGMTGDVGQVNLFLPHIAPPDTRPDAWHVNREEPLYRRALTGLDPQPIRPATQSDRPMLEAWYRDYLIDTGLHDASSAGSTAPQDAARAIGGSTRLLLHDGTPVAMASVNAKAGSAIQIGGVFVPRALRGKGFAGRVTTGLLAEHAALGARMALLFAASTQAARVYERIGFEPVGRYKIALLKTKVTL